MRSFTRFISILDNWQTLDMKLLSLAKYLRLQDVVMLVKIVLITYFVVLNKCKF